MHSRGPPPQKRGVNRKVLNFRLEPEVIYQLKLLALHKKESRSKPCSAKGSMKFLQSGICRGLRNETRAVEHELERRLATNKARRLGTVLLASHGRFCLSRPDVVTAISLFISPYSSRPFLSPGTGGGSR
jgi:hypothetical protein